MKSQSGSIHIIIVIVLIIAGAAAYFIFKPGQPNKAIKPSPSPSISAYQSQKLEEYDKNKEEIKSKLNLSEEEFQILKRYSGD